MVQGGPGRHKGYKTTVLGGIKGYKTTVLGGKRRPLLHTQRGPERLKGGLLHTQSGPERLKGEVYTHSEES